MTERRLEVTGLSVSLGGSPVVRDVTLPVLQPGQILALVGPNAAGKSTLLRGLGGLVPVSGTAALGGADLIRMRPAIRAARVAYLPQTLPSTVGFTVLEGVICGLEAAGLRGSQSRNRAVRTLARLDLLTIANMPLDRLSGGQRQLAGLAQALAREPDVLLLDEPTSALDLRRQLQVMTLVQEMARERAIVVIVVLHDLSFACRWADLVCLLEKGRVAAAGRPGEALTTATLRRVYGVETELGSDSRGRLTVSVTGVG
jgi:iron complex transport system ATP-binding protein